jgi:hypothetical protein
MSKWNYFQPGAPDVDPDAFARETLRIGQFLMAFGAVGLSSLMLCRLFLPQDGARELIQFAAFVMSAWPLLLGSAMTELAAIPAKSRTVARALLALAACYLLGRLLLTTMR